MRQGRKRWIENEQAAYKSEQQMSARQRREQDLADSRRRDEDEELDKRMADTLKKESEYRPMPFGGDDFQGFLDNKELEQQEPLQQVSKPTIAEPEVPENLKEPKQDSYLVQMLKAQPTFTPTGKTSRADTGKQKEPTTFDIYDPKTMDKVTLDLDIKQTMLEGIDTAMSVTNEALGDAQENVRNSIVNDADPRHGNFWGTLLTSVLTDLSSTPSSATSYAVTQAYKKEPNKGAMEWAKDFIGNAAINKNVVEVKSDAGEINKYQELIAHGMDIRQYLSNINRAIELSDQLDQLKQLPQTEETIGLIQDVQSRIAQLDAENKQMSKAVKDAYSYYDDQDYHSIISYEASIGAPRERNTTYNLDAVNSIINKNGYSGLSKELKDAIKSHTNNIESKIQGLEKEFEKKRPELLNRMADNIREMKSWIKSDYNPSKEFVEKAEAVTEFNFKDPATYTHGLSGLIGSSMSFGGYQLASTAIGLAGAVATALGTGGAGLLAAGAAASTGLGVVGGHYENDAEVADHYTQLFVDRLNKNGLYEQWQKEGREALGKKDASDDELMWAMAAGIYEPKEKIKNVAETATYGLNNLYKNDMVAVVGQEIFEAGLNFFAPTVKLMKAGALTPEGATRFTRLRNLVENHPTVAKVLKATNKIADQEVGGAIASSIAFPLVLAGKAAEAGIKAILPKTAVRNIVKRLSLSSDIIEKMPKTLLGAKAVGKDLLDFSAKVFGAGWSEAIEEGKQYLNGKKFLDGTYSGESDTLMDAILNDIAGGSRAAYAFVGDMFGMQTDKELIANMKGGFLGGFGHTATISGFNAVANIHNDLRANDFVINNVLAQKAADRTTIANNSYLGTQTSPQQYHRIMNAFDQMENIARESEEKHQGTDDLAFTVEDVKAQREAYQKVFDFANSKHAQDAAKQLDIKPGTKQFGNFVGLVMWAKDLTTEKIKQLGENEAKANQLVNAFLTGNQEEDRDLATILKDMSIDDLLELNETLVPGDQISDVGAGQIGTTQLRRRNNAAAIRAALPNLVSYIKEIASLDALFTLRDQLEMNAQPTQAEKRRLRSVKRQISKLQKNSQFEAVKNATMADDFAKIPNQELHDVLRDFYRESANLMTDMDNAAALQYALLGGKIAGVEFLTNPELQDAYRNAQEDIKDRKKTALNIISGYLNSVKSDEDLQQAIHDTFESQMKAGEQESVEDMNTEEPIEATETPSKPSEQPQPSNTAQQTQTPVTEPENAPYTTSQQPATQQENQRQETQQEQPQQVEQDDTDEQIAQIEREYASSEDTMFVESDVNTDFGISQEDWNKVTPQTMQMITNLKNRWQRFVQKWAGKILPRNQYNGVKGNVVKFRAEFNSLRERALLDIQEYDSRQNQPQTEHSEPTDDELWEGLHSYESFASMLYSEFEKWVQELSMRWDHFLSAHNTTNHRLWNEALANVRHILDLADEIGINLGVGSIGNYSRIKSDIDKYNALYDGSAPEIPVPPTVNTSAATIETPWGKYTTTHTRSTASQGYNIEDSVSITDPKMHLSDVTANPDFVQNGIFWFTARQSSGMPKIQLNVMYNGHQYTPIDIHTSNEADGRGKTFYRSVMQMLQNANGRRVTPQKSAMRRSNGIIEDKDNMQTFEQAGFLTNDNMYSIEYSPSQDTFCIVKYIKNEFGQDIPIAYIPGQEQGISQHEVYRYSAVRPDHTKPADGGMVMMIHPPYPEIDKDSRVPINVHYSPLTEGDAQLIIDLLSGKYMQDDRDYGAHAMENQVFTEDGVSKGLTRMQVLRMLIRYKASSEKYNPYEQTLRYIEYDKNDQRYVILHGNFGEGVTIPREGRFNILDVNDQKLLKDFLLAHHNKTFTYNEFLECRINRLNYDFNHPLHGLSEFRSTIMGQQIFRNGGQLTFGNSTIVFDDKDFGDARHPEGLSGLAWAMRRGFVQTKFNGFTNTLINFDESVPLTYNDQQQATPQEKPSEAPKTPARGLVDVITPEDVDIDNSLEDMDLMIGQKQKGKFDVSAANEFLSKVLGEEITEDNITERLQEMAKTNASVLGLCHYSGKLLFDPHAPQGTVYHEAFHKIVELILGDRTRKALYKAYARKMHIKYKDDADLLSNSKIREGLAEEFRYYMENRPTISLGSLRHPFQLLSKVAKLMSKIGDLRLYSFYALTRLGATKHLFKANDQKTLRYLETHGAFIPFSMGGHEFKNILNRYQYRVLRNTLVYLVFRTNDIGITGEGLENLRISKQAILRDKNYQTMINSNAHGAQALQELVENIEYVEQDLRSYLARAFEINRNEDDEREDIQDIEAGEGAMESSFNQLKYSHEVSQFSRTGAKVKFIFARIPKKRFGYRAGKRVSKNVLNDEGLVEYFDVKYVFNSLVNQCHDCRNAKELLNRLAKLGKDNAMFRYIHENVVKPLYENAQLGDADSEAVFAQMLVALHAAKGEYVIGKAHRSADGTWGVTIQSTDSDYNAREYKTVWSQLFANGSEYLEKTTSGYQMKFRKGTDRHYSPEVFRNIYNFFDSIRTAVQKGTVVKLSFKDEQGKVQTTNLDVTKEDQFDHVKDEFCNTLQKLGIQFSKDELNYTLQIQFGSSDYTAMSMMFERNNTTNISPFLDWINGCYNPVTKSLNITQNGTLNGKNIETAIGSFGFVGMLADAKYKYLHDHDQLSVLATKGNRYYVISENNLITDITDDINASVDGDNTLVNQLKSYHYNWLEQNGNTIGSLILKNAAAGQKLTVKTVAGFRTDQKGDLGQDYAEISPAEDYITKIQILMQGGLIFPTMSDKKTWTYLTGVDIPGLSFITQFADLGNGRYTITQDRAVLQQMLDYAKCELQAIQDCIKQVKGYTDDRGVKHPPLADSQKIANYHKGGEYDGHTIIQGGRFGVLTGIYDDNGKWISFNRIHDNHVIREEDGKKIYKYVDEVANWRTAQEYFFGIPDKEHPGMFWLKTTSNDAIYVNEQQLKERQFTLLSRSMQKQVQNELDYAANLGLIEKVTTDQSVPVVLRYKNKLLDGDQIRSLKESYGYIASDQQRESLAITAFLTRASAASNISLQEVERLYAGHPAFFKWTYGENGEIVDRSVDQHKRLGGLISTGQNNVLDIPGIPTKYKCAEINNELVGSQLQDELKTMIEDGELRSSYMRIRLEEAGINLTNSNSDEAKQLISEIEQMPIDQIKTVLEKDHSDIYKMLVSNAAKKASDFTKDIDVADGAAYITDQMAEWLLRMVGSWDSKIERAFKILRGQEVDGKVYTTNDILTLQQAYRDVVTTVIGSQKYTAYGFRFANGIATPYYDKMALFPMFKCMSTGATANILDKMNKEGVHMLLINSAVKVGSQGSMNITASDFKEHTEPFNTYEQEFKYLRKQFNTDPHGDETIKMGTQMTKVAMAGLMPGREYLIVEGVDENGNKTYRTASAVEVRNDIMNCINQISNLGEKKVRERFIKETTVSNEDGTTTTTKEVKIDELSKFLKEELASRGASQEAIDAVSLTVDEDGEYQMYVPPVAQGNFEWLQSIITSMINKNVIDINTPGGAFIQRSVWGMEGTTTVQGSEDLPSSIYEGKELQMINEEGTMDCVLSIDFYDDIIPDVTVKDDQGKTVYEVDGEGQFLYTTYMEEGVEVRKRIPKKRKMSFDEARQWLIENNIISGRKKNGEWSNATANMVASRIPTQAQSSIHALRCVDVLPVVRDTIVLPKEFTKITGSDFDIDKLYLSRLYFRKEAGKATSSFEEGTHEYYANRLLNNYIALLKDAGSQEKEGINRTANQNHASIDGDTKLLKDIVKDLEEGGEGQELDPFTPYSLWANAQTKTEFITGKFGIGPFALNNNSHILTMLYGVRFVKDSFLGRLGMNRLDKASDRYGNSILSWLSGLINAHVDVAKDPYISKLNVNPYTYNLINLMIRTGFGKDTFYFTKQPIMLEMARAYNNAASQYGQESSRSKYRRQKEAVDEVVFDFIKRNFHIPSDVTNLKQANKVLEGYFRKVRGIEVEDAMRKLLEKDNDIMHQISKKKIPMDGKARMYEIDNGIKLSAAEVQYIVYRAKMEFQPFESDLSDLVKYSKIDTKKQGKNIVEQMAYKDGIDALFDIEHNFYGKFETLKDYYTDSYIKDKTENALNLFFDIMSTFSIESTPQFQIQISDICRAIGEINPSADVRKAVSRQIMNYIRAGFFNTWAENNHINIKGLVSGKNTISDRLEDIRIKIMTDPAYADMRTNDGSIKNYLLASLVQGFQYKEDNRIGPLNAGTKPATHNTAKFVKTLNFMDSDHINEDDMAEAWDELLSNEEHQDIKDFARDLIMYAFITSGGNSGQNLFKFIPNSWKLNSYGEDQSKESFAQYMQKQLDLYKNATEELLPIDIDEIILNNWFDDKFIPTVKPDGFTGYYTGRYFYQGNQKPDMSIPVLLIKENASEDQDDDKYIKVRRDASDQYTPRNYTVYKAVAYTTDGRLIYAMVDPKGNKFPRDVIYEMRRDDSDYKESATVAAHSAAFTESIMITKHAMGVAGSNLADILRDFVGELKKVERGTAFALLDLFTKDATLKDLIANAADLNSGITAEEARDIANTKQEAEQNNIPTYKPALIAIENQLGPDVELDIWAGKDSENKELSNLAVRPFKIKIFENEPERAFNSVEQCFQYVKFRLLARYLGFDSNTDKFLLSNQKLTGEDYKENVDKYVTPGTKASFLKQGSKNSGVILHGGDTSYEEEYQYIKNHIEKIAKAADPYEAKRLGGKDGGYTIVGNSGSTFLDTIWDSGELVSEDVMKAAMTASFEQNEQALQNLLNTGNATLTHKKGGQWSKMMPQLLMEVRSELKQKYSQSSVEVWDLNNIIGKEIYVGTKDADGFHEDELSGEILGIQPTSTGYSMRAEIEGREYFINLTADFKIANEKSKFHEILIVDGDKFMNFHDVISGKNIKYNTIDDAVNGKIDIVEYLAKLRKTLGC